MQAVSVSGQATILVDPLDPVYRDIEQLIGNGLVKGVILGQRPYSVAEIGRVVADAHVTLTRIEARLNDPTLAGESRDALGARVGFLQDLLESISERFDLRQPTMSDSSSRRSLFRAKPLHTLSLDLTRLTTPTRPIPPSNGLGTIDARLNPFLSNREGWPLEEGSNLVVSSEHFVESKYIALFVSPALFARPRSDSATHVSGRLQQLQLRLVFRNVALDVGRESVLWGQGRDVGLLASNNSPPLSLIKISNESPFTLPWIFRQLGSTKLSLFYADLGKDQNFPHPYLIGYKVSVAPSARLELGAAVFSKSGGRGSPPASLSARIVDVFPFLDAAFFGGVIGTRGKFQFSDRYAGIDGRWRWPAASGAEVFWEVLLNDFDVRRLRSVLWEDAGHVAGVLLPRLSANGRVSGSLELHHTGVRYYEHEQFTSGQTMHRTLIGDPLGPDASGLYANLDWSASPRRHLTLDAALERRSNDQYEFRSTARGFGFRRIEARPKEQRARVLAAWRVTPRAGQWGFLSQLGYEETRSFAFVRDDTRRGWLARFAVEYRMR